MSRTTIRTSWAWLAARLRDRGTRELLRRVRRIRAGQEVADLAADLRGPTRELAGELAEVLRGAERASQTDTVTGLGNRRAFHDVFAREFNRARRYNRPLSLAIIDLDFFRTVNDALGHQAGDQALAELAAAMKDDLRGSDSLCRLGGDEFGLVMPETGIAEAETVCQRLRQAIASCKVGAGEMAMSLTTSAGLVDVNVPGAVGPEGLFDLADQALHAAKRAGRDCLVRAEQLEQLNTLTEVADHSLLDRLRRELAGLDAKYKRMLVDSIGGLIGALEARDEHTANHSAKVRHYAEMLGREMNLPERTIEHLRRAAVLHDIGKIGLPDSILLKKGPLTDLERKIVQRHPVISVRIMEAMKLLTEEIPLVRHHHERYDGDGYPEGLSGTRIPLGARVLAVADAFDAMVSSRVYRSGLGLDAAVAELRRCSGTQFDPEVVNAFCALLNRGEITEATLAATVA